MKNTLLCQAVLFSAALFALTTGGAFAATIAGTYAAVTPQSVELLTLAPQRGGVRGTYRVLHLDETQRTGLDDQTVGLAGLSQANENALALADTRTMELRFDRTFQRAVATAPSLPNSTQSFSRVTPAQVSLLIEMARYGGLWQLCQAHRATAECRQLSAQLGDIVPFRPFPQGSANRPVLGYTVTARLDRTLAVNP